MRSHWGHIKRCFSVSVVKLHRRGSATNGIPRLVSILVVHIVKAVVSPGAVNRCLPLPLFEMLVERAPNMDAGLDTINACKVRNSLWIFLECELIFPLSCISPCSGAAEHRDEPGLRASSSNIRLWGQVPDPLILESYLWFVILQSGTSVGKVLH